MRILLPHRNLGCLGIRTQHWYADIYRKPGWGIFFTNGSVKIWVGLRGGFVRVEDGKGTRKYDSTYNGGKPCKG